jgi:phytanoyl-CoA dioxygenase PhyH
MLTAEQREEFNRTGLVRLPGAVTQSAADEMLRTVWDCLRDRYYIHREARDTWPKPETRNGRVEQIRGSHRFLGTHHLPRSATFEQVGNAVVHGALDELIGGAQWQRPATWGSLLVAFPESTGPWDVPSSNWHLDLPASPSFGLTAVRVFTCLAKLPPRGGGTLFVSGSHRLVESQAREGERLSSPEARKHLVRAHPWMRALCSRDDTGDRVRRFVSRATLIDGVEVRVVEMTGEPGDVVLAHPMLLHAPALNCSSSPRFALSAMAFRSDVESVKLTR